MKQFTIKLIAACSLFLPASGIFSTAHAAESLRVTVNGMVCAFCAQGIEKRLSGLGATKAVFVDLKARLVAVEAREGQKLDEKTVRSEIVDAGYDVVKIETVARSVTDIRSDAKARK